MCWAGAPGELTPCARAGVGSTSCWGISQGLSLCRAQVAAAVTWEHHLLPSDAVSEGR